jgi:serine/threonine-protein kinase
VQGTPFGRYRLMELVGRGGMGEVWRAHDTDTDRIVAIKVLLTEAGYEQRFRRAVHAAAQLTEPQIIAIHEVGQIAAWPRKLMCRKVVATWPGPSGGVGGLR